MDSSHPPFFAVPNVSPRFVLFFRDGLGLHQVTAPNVYGRGWSSQESLVHVPGKFSMGQASWVTNIENDREQEVQDDVEDTNRSVRHYVCTNKGKRTVNKLSTTANTRTKKRTVVAFLCDRSTAASSASGRICDTCTGQSPVLAGSTPSGLPPSQWWSGLSSRRDVATAGAILDRRAANSRPSIAGPYGTWKSRHEVVALAVVLTLLGLLLLGLCHRRRRQEVSWFLVWVLAKRACRKRRRSASAAWPVSMTEYPTPLLFHHRLLVSHLVHFH
jgi:hypothetical protein